MTQGPGRFAVSRGCEKPDGAAQERQAGEDLEQPTLTHVRVGEKHRQHAQTGAVRKTNPKQDGD